MEMRKMRNAIVSWSVATVLVAVVMWIVFGHGMGTNEKERAHGGADCTGKPCYQLLDARVKIIELAMECPNNKCDRFKGVDAKRMEARIMAENAKKNEEQDKKINALLKR